MGRSNPNTTTRTPLFSDHQSRGGFIPIVVGGMVFVKYVVQRKEGSEMALMERKTGRKIGVGSNLIKKDRRGLLHRYEVQEVGATSVRVKECSGESNTPLFFKIGRAHV